MTSRDGADDRLLVLAGDERTPSGFAYDDLLIDEEIDGSACRQPGDAVSLTEGGFGRDATGDLAGLDLAAQDVR